MVTSISWSPGQARSQEGRGGGSDDPPPQLPIPKILFHPLATFLPNETPPLGLRSTFPPNKTPPPWEILATGLRRGMNAYMCGGNHGRQSHATSRIRLTHVHRTVLDGHVLGALIVLWKYVTEESGRLWPFSGPDLEVFPSRWGHYC